MATMMWCRYYKNGVLFCMHFLLMLLSHTIMLSSITMTVFMMNIVTDTVGVAYSWNNSTACNTMTK